MSRARQQSFTRISLGFTREDFVMAKQCGKVYKSISTLVLFVMNSLLFELNSFIPNSIKNFRNFPDGKSMVVRAKQVNFGWVQGPLLGSGSSWQSVAFLTVKCAFSNLSWNRFVSFNFHLCKYTTTYFYFNTQKIWVILQM